MSKHKRVKFPVGFVDWMSGFCDAFDDFSDGAWQAACENAVEAYNEEHKTNIDPYDGWLYWVQQTSKVKS